VILEVVRSAKERLFKDVFLAYTRSPEYTYLHEVLQCPKKAEFEREDLKPSLFWQTVMRSLTAS